MHDWALIITITICIGHLTGISISFGGLTGLLVILFFWDIFLLWLFLLFLLVLLALFVLELG